MEKLRKLFGGINLTWPKVIIFAIMAGVYTAAMAILPIAKDTSFSDLAVSFEVWILFGIFIIMNSKSATDSALKCFVFFLVSQPLIYLLQVPFSWLGWQLFTYYKYWFIWTLLTIPMGFIGWYMKKDKWWSLAILAPILGFLGFHFCMYLAETMFSFPRHLLTAILCAVSAVLYPLIIFKNKKIRITGAIIGIISLVVFGSMTLCNPPVYSTEILSNGGSLGVVFDDSYKVYLADESFGKVDIRLIKQVNDWFVHAEFRKAGNTEVILQSPSGEKTTFDIKVARHTYTINKK